MKKFLVSLTLFAFSVSPAAFGANITAADLYKQTYIDLKKGKDGGETLKNLLTMAQANGMQVKDVLESAVAKGWMSQEQLNTVLDIAAKNSKLLAANTDGAKKQIRVSAADMKAFEQAIGGQVTGAAYHCGYYHSCYYNNGVVVVVLVVLILAILISVPTYTVVYY